MPSADGLERRRKHRKVNRISSSLNESFSFVPLPSGQLLWSLNGKMASIWLCSSEWGHHAAT